MLGDGLSHLVSGLFQSHPLWGCSECLESFWLVPWNQGCSSWAISILVFISLILDMGKSQREEPHVAEWVYVVIEGADVVSTR